jgi:type II secretory pathway pseudopilin PulG
MTKRSDSGFGLIEAIVSLALLSVVLMSIGNLFVLGQRQIKSGRTSTTALSTAQSILETVEQWGFGETYSRFGFDGAATTYSVDSRTNGAAAGWQSALSSKLPGSYATIDLASLSSGTPPAMSSTGAIRVTVTVFWTEGSRSRTIRLATVRM